MFSTSMIVYVTDLVVSLCLLGGVERNVAQFTVQWFTQFPQPQRVLLLFCTQRGPLILGLLADRGWLTQERTGDDAGHRGGD